MITYTVYEPPEAPADRLDRAESLAFVREGFNWVAAAFAPIWIIANQLWIVLGFYLAALGLIQSAVWAFGLDQRALSYVMSALHLIIGFEADSLRRWTLEHQGWRSVGSVNGRNAEDCERRFFDAWLPGQPYIRASALSESQMAGQAEPVPFSSKAPEATKAAVGGDTNRGWRSAFGRRS